MAQLMMDVTTPQNNGIAGASYQQPSTVSGEAAPPTRVLGRVLSLTPSGSAPTEEALLVDFQEIFSLSFEQEEMLKEVFDSLDTDGDGEITGAEIRTAFEQLGLTFEDAQLKAIIGRFSVEGGGHGGGGSGGITWAAWKECLSWHLITNLENVFKTFDRNRDGQISWWEVQRILRLCGEQHDDEHCKALIKECDVDGDGEISLDEFTRALDQRPDLFSEILASDLHKAEEVARDYVYSRFQQRQDGTLRGLIPRPVSVEPSSVSGGGGSGGGGGSDTSCGDGTQDVTTLMLKLRALVNSDYWNELETARSEPSPTAASAQQHAARFWGDDGGGGGGGGGGGNGRPSLPDARIHHLIPRVRKRSEDDGDDSGQSPLDKKAKTEPDSSERRGRGRPLVAPQSWLAKWGNDEDAWQRLSQTRQKELREIYPKKRNRRKGGATAHRHVMPSSVPSASASSSSSLWSSSFSSSSSSSSWTLPSVPSSTAESRFTTEELNILTTFESEDFALLNALVPTPDNLVVPSTFQVKPWAELEQSKEDLKRWQKAASKTHILNVLKGFAENS